MPEMIDVVMNWVSAHGARDASEDVPESTFIDNSETEYLVLFLLQNGTFQ